MGRWSARLNEARKLGDDEDGEGDGPGVPVVHLIRISAVVELDIDVRDPFRKVGLQLERKPQ